MSFTLQERSGIFDLVHACIVSDHTIESLTSVLDRASEFLLASFAATIHFGQTLISKDPVYVSTCDPSGIDFFEALLPTWLENEVPICVSAPIATSAEPASFTLLVHGRRGWHGETTIFGFWSLKPHPQYSTILKLIVPHLHELLCRVSGEKSRRTVAFTTAEREIIAHMISGKSNKQIAAALGKADTTVRNQLHSIFAKLNVGRRIDAIRALASERLV